MLPIESRDPTLPIDSTEPRDPMDSSESDDQRDHRDVEGVGMAPWSAADLPAVHPSADVW